MSIPSMRTPPANLQAEQALLGALLANNRALDRVAEFLQPHHFTDPVHGRIYAEIAARAGRGQLADAVTLHSVFQGTGALDDAGGVDYLAKLLGAMVGIINAGDYGRAIRDCWMRRELIAACEDTANEAFASDDAAAVLAAMEQRLTAIADGAGDTAPLVPVAAAIAAALRVTELAARRDSPLAGLSTGYPALDRVTTGLLPGEMFVLAARPAMGKTALGAAIALRAAAAIASRMAMGGDRGSVLFWSGEMTPEQLGARLAAAQARLSTISVFTGRGYDPPEHADRAAARPLDAAEWDALGRAERDAARLPLHIDARPGITVAALRARARRLRRTAGLDLLVVDYLGLMQASETARKHKLYEQMADVSREIKRLAEELRIPVLVLAQLNRNNEQREDKRPMLSDLRESGHIEQDADRVAFLHRPHYYLSRSGPPESAGRESEERRAQRVHDYHAALDASVGVAEVILGKNRHGPAVPTRLRFQQHTTWFRDESEPADSPAW